MIPARLKQQRSCCSFTLSDPEASILLRYAFTRCAPHWALFVAMALCSGIRSQEILALNIRDFPGAESGDFSRVYVRVQKQKRYDKVILKPLIPFVQHVLKKYVALYDGSLPGGWFFVKERHLRHGRRWGWSDAAVLASDGKPFMKSATAGAWMAKTRKILGVVYPGFLEKCPHGTYRIHVHTLRHWHQTRLSYFVKDPYVHQELMGYSDVKEILTYVHRQEFAQVAPEIMHEAFEPFMLAMMAEMNLDYR